MENILCTGIDVTEEKIARQALEKESQRYRAIMEASMDGIYILDTEGRLLECNAAFLDNLGYSREESRHLNVFDWNALWSRDEILELLRSDMRHNSIFETVHRRKDGTMLNVEINATSVILDGNVQVFNSVRDITERKRAEAELRERDRTLKLIAENIHDVIWTMDFSGKFTYVSPSAKQLFGYTAEEFVHLSFADFMVPASAALAYNHFAESLALRNRGSSSCKKTWNSSAAARMDQNFGFP